MNRTFQKMKLIYCKNCRDIVRLFDSERFCKCGKCSGAYIDGKNAWYKGGENVVPLGVDNNSFRRAICQPWSYYPNKVEKETVGTETWKAGNHADIQSRLKSCNGSMWKNRGVGERKYHPWY